MAEHLDHLLPRYRFLDVSVQRSQSCLLRLIEPAASHGDGSGRKHHKRHHHHRDQRQPHIGIHHQAEGSDHIDGAGDDLHHRIIQHFSHRIHIVGETAHDVSVVIRIVEPHRQLLDPGKQIVSQPEDGSLRDADHDPGLKILGRNSHRVDGRHPQKRGKQNLYASLRRGQAVDDGAQHIGTGQGRKGVEDDAEKHHCQSQTVLFNIGKEPVDRFRRILRPSAPAAASPRPWASAGASPPGAAPLGLGLLCRIGIFPDQGFFSLLIHDALTSLSIWE